MSKLQKMDLAISSSLISRTGAGCRLTLIVCLNTYHAQNIPQFLKSFSGEVDMSEALEPLESYKTFNEVTTQHLQSWKTSQALCC